MPAHRDGHCTSAPSAEDTVKESADVATEATGVPTIDSFLGNSTRDFLSIFAAHQLDCLLRCEHAGMLSFLLPDFCINYINYVYVCLCFLCCSSDPALLAVGRFAKREYFGNQSARIWHMLCVIHFLASTV